MVRSCRISLKSILWIVLFLFCAMTAAASDAQPASTNPLAMVSADSVFYMQINDLTGTLGKLDQFLSGVSPVNISFLLPMQLARFLGGAEAKGINLSGKFAVFGPLPGGNKPAPEGIGILVPVSDYLQFTQGNPNVGPPDAQGIASIGDKLKPTFIAVDVPGFALLTTPDYRATLIAMKKSISDPALGTLAKKLTPEELKQAQETPVWAYVNMQLISKQYGPAIQAKLQEAQKAIEQAQKQAGQTAAMGNNVDIINILLPQLQSFTFTLEPAPAALRCKYVLTAVPNTEMAKIFQGTTGKPDRKYSAFLENDAMMNMSISINPAVYPAFYNFYFDLIAKVANKGTTSAEIDKLKKLAIDNANNFTGIAAVSLIADSKSKPPFQLQYVAGIKNPKVFYQSIEQMIPMFDSGLLADIMKETGLGIKVELKRKVETYKGVPVDSLRLVFNSTRPGSKEFEALTTLLGQGIELRFAVINNLLVYTFAGDPAAAVHKLIDQVKDGSVKTPPAEFQESMQLIPGSEQADFIVTYNILRLLRLISAVVPNSIPEISVPTKSNIAVAGKLNNGSISIETALPKEHLMELMNFIMQLQIKQAPGAKL
jgi:hypothetical protein